MLFYYNRIRNPLSSLFWNWNVLWENHLYILQRPPSSNHAICLTSLPYKWLLCLLLSLNIHTNSDWLRGRHLTRNRAIPNHLIHSLILCINVSWETLNVCGADTFVSLLSVLSLLSIVIPWNYFFIQLTLQIVRNLFLGVFADRCGISANISNPTLLIHTLNHLFRPSSAISKTIRSCAKKTTCDKRGWRIVICWLSLWYIGDLPLNLLPINLWKIRERITDDLPRTRVAFRHTRHATPDCFIAFKSHNILFFLMEK